MDIMMGILSLISRYTWFLLPFQGYILHILLSGPKPFWNTVAAQLKKKQRSFEKTSHKNIEMKFPYKNQCY